MHSFQTLGLSDPLQRAITAAGYETPTPIQSEAIPHLLAGRDVLGCAQTGTARRRPSRCRSSIASPRATRRPGARGPRALVLTPTRELALQINEGFATYGRQRRAEVRRRLRRRRTGSAGRGVPPQHRHIVATPGRLLDLMQQRHAPLDAVEMLVLDEATACSTWASSSPSAASSPRCRAKRQNLMFSATMPDEIQKLANKILVDPVKVAVAPVSSTAEKVRQWVLFVDRGHKRALLRRCLRIRRCRACIVFTRTKHGANKVAEELDRNGVGSAAIPRNKSQNARQRALDAFKGGRVRVLVRDRHRGARHRRRRRHPRHQLRDPDEPESYVHRIGRTARAGASGVALSFCDAEERGSLPRHRAPHPRRGPRRL